jgi:hypothetical protein
MAFAELLSRSPFLRSLRQSHYVLPVRPEFLTSASINFVNPRHHIVNTDQVTQVFPASAVEGLSDENVLALFTKGFFGGFVFGPERFVLRTGGYRLIPARYSGNLILSLLTYTIFFWVCVKGGKADGKNPGFETPSDAISIWDKSALPNTHLLPVGSHLFGSFQMLDKHIATNPSDHPSYVDYGFGSDQFIFGGSHRFQITRLAATQAEAEPQIQMELQHIRCNPQKNQPSPAEYIERFHYVYAKALFANGIRELGLR